MMKERGIWKGLRLYRTVITRNIVLFMAVGLLNIFFADSGFFPNVRMQQLSRLIYQTALPLIAGYLVGREWGSEVGGMAGVIAAAGILLSECSAVLIGAVAVASLTGWVASRGYEQFRDRMPAAGSMLGRNLWIVAVGGLGAWFGMSLVSPVLNVVSRNILWAIEWLQKNQMMFLSSILVEPVKLLYLNNDLNHGLLIPLGMEQVQQTGSSMLFLLETNPGPGLGVLAAVYLCEKERKKEMVSAILTQTVGGIHEIYFPVVLGNLRLASALVAGGMAGTAWCSAAHAGLAGPVSPGSILTILLMAEPGSRLRVLGAFLLSALVSCLVAVVMLKGPARKQAGRGVKLQDGDIPMTGSGVPAGESPVTEVGVSAGEGPATINSISAGEGPATGISVSTGEGPVTGNSVSAGADMSGEASPGERITRIYIVCAAGLGSSAMGASLFRRTMKKMGITGVQAAAAPADGIPEDAQLILCQREYVRMLPATEIPVLPVSNLMDQREYEQIIITMKERGQIV